MEGLVDRRCGLPSPKRVPLATVEEVLRLYQEQYIDFNVRHFHEKLGLCTKSVSIRGKEDGLAPALPAFCAKPAKGQTGKSVPPTIHNDLFRENSGPS